ncbi:uncharacterized protein [Physcomitrium patens]|uniref:uncharacterized protein n=1 Tax=Physcomitrium patens TaxID=3218 RepID=UPI003CCDAE71
MRCCALEEERELRFLELVETVRLQVVDGEVFDPYDELALDAVFEVDEPRFLDLELSHCCFIDLQESLDLLGWTRWYFPEISFRLYDNMEAGNDGGAAFRERKCAKSRIVRSPMCYTPDSMEGFNVSFS